ncbi:PIN domain nuclease [Jiangella gansuensis]|uniref:PIN domain nuclease n=1 Tax=Jiangella gansuensis TaxID=281473 RepID=UPI0004B6CC2F|nr:PIN domain nuclease [Jiangella gansuensis]
MIDTSAAARMRHEAVADQVVPLISAGLVATCAPLDFEALFSPRDPRDYERQRNDRRAAYEYLPTSDEDWQRVFEVHAALAKVSRWRDVGMPDLLVAAIAERHGATLLHYDADFDTIRNVTRQDARWVVPRGSVP